MDLSETIINHDEIMVRGNGMSRTKWIPAFILMLIFIAAFESGGEVVSEEYRETILFPIRGGSLDTEIEDTSLIIPFWGVIQNDFSLGEMNGVYDDERELGIHLTFKNDQSANTELEISLKIDQDGDGSYDLISFFGNNTIPYTNDDEYTLIEKPPESINGQFQDLNNATLTLSIKKKVGQTPSVNLHIGSESFIKIPYHRTAPVAIFDGPNEVKERTEVKFNASDSYDPNGDELTYNWDFNASDGIQIDASGILVSHNYSLPGSYDVTLTVSDGINTDSIVEEILVKENHMPVASAGKNITVNRNQVFRFDSSGTLDEDGDSLNFTWKVENGDTIYGRNPEYIFMVSGEYEVTLFVSDGLNTTQDSIFVFVNYNKEPVAEFSVDTTDPEFGNPVFFNATETHDIEDDEMTYQWDFGDGEEAEGIIVNHSYFSSGEFMVILTVSDGIDEVQANWLLTIPENLPPSGKLTVPDYSISNSEASFSLDEIEDPEGADFTVRWYVNGNELSGGTVANHTFENPGTYNISVVAEDIYGAKGEYFKELEVLDKTMYRPTSLLVDDNVTFHHGVEPGWELVYYEYEKTWSGVQLREIHVPKGGSRVYELDLPDRARFNVSVSVTKGGNIDILLLNKENRDKYMNPNVRGTTYMDWYEFGTSFNTAGYNFLYTGGEERYLVIANNGKMMGGASPEGPVEYDITVEFKDYGEKKSTGDTESDPSGGFRAIQVICIGLFVVFPFIIIITFFIIAMVRKKGRKFQEIPDTPKSNDIVEEVLNENPSLSPTPDSVQYSDNPSPGIVDAPPNEDLDALMMFSNIPEKSPDITGKDLNKENPDLSTTPGPNFEDFKGEEDPFGVGNTDSEGDSRVGDLFDQ